MGRGDQAKAPGWLVAVAPGEGEEQKRERSYGGMQCLPPVRYPRPRDHRCVVRAGQAQHSVRGASLALCPGLMLSQSSWSQEHGRAPPHRPGPGLCRVSPRLPGESFSARREPGAAGLRVPAPSTGLPSASRGSSGAGGAPRAPPAPAEPVRGLSHLAMAERSPREEREGAMGRNRAWGRGHPAFPTASPPGGSGGAACTGSGGGGEDGGVGERDGDIPGAVRGPDPAPGAEPGWPLLRHGLPGGGGPRAQSGGGGAPSEPAPPGHGERRRRARGLGLGLGLGLGHGAAHPLPRDREAAGDDRVPGGEGPPLLQILHGRLARRGGAQRARARLQVGVGRAPGGGPALAVPAQPGQSLLHGHQHGGTGAGPPAGLPGARHLLLLLPRLAHQRRGSRLLHHVEEQRAARGHGRSPATRTHGQAAEHRLHYPGDHHHRALHFTQRQSFLEDVLACKYLEEEEDNFPFGVFTFSLATKNCHSVGGQPWTACSGAPSEGTRASTSPPLGNEFVQVMG